MLNPNIIARDLGLRERQDHDINLHIYSHLTDEELEARINALTEGR